MDECRFELCQTMEGFHQIFEVCPRHLLAHLPVARQVIVQIPSGGLAHDYQVTALERLSAGRVDGGPVVKNLQDGRVLGAEETGELGLVIEEGIGRE